MKCCNKCKRYRSLDCFLADKRKRDGYRSWCKKCESRLHKEYHASNKDKRNQQNKEWYQKNLLKERRRGRDKSLQAKYGISLLDYEAKLILQPMCAICDSLFSDTNPACIDHCHLAGKVRDLLCRSCNAGLGLFQEKIQNFEKAI